MKVLHVTTSSQGGAGIAAIRLHNALLKNGIKSEILFLRNTKSMVNSYIYDDLVKSNREKPSQPPLSLKNYFKEKLTGEYKRSIEEYNKAIQLERERHKKYFASDPAQYEIFTSPLSNVDIMETLAYKNADIIHFHWIANFVDFPSFFIKNKKPIVWTLHDANPFLGGFHLMEDIEKNKSTHGEQEEEFRKLKTNFLKNVNKLSIVTPSEWLGEASEKSEAFQTRKHYHINNCIDVIIFKLIDKVVARQILNIPLEKKVILISAIDLRSKNKGGELLVDVLNKVNNDNLQVLVLGNNPVNSERKMFFNLGFVSDERLLAIIYNAVDAVVIPSKNENLPNVMLESLCCGTPVISFSVGGMKEEIETGVNGILCGDVSAENLKQGIENFINGKYNFDNRVISQKAHLKYSESFIVGKYMQVYYSLVS